MLVGGQEFATQSSALESSKVRTQALKRMAGDDPRGLHRQSIRRKYSGKAAESSRAASDGRGHSRGLLGKVRETAARTGEGLRGGPKGNERNRPPPVLPR
jgi:hypothetical protein